MSDFLEQLITHPIAGQLAMKDLRGSIREKESSSSRNAGDSLASDKSSTVTATEPAAASDSASNTGALSKSVPSLFPLLLFCEGRLEARVSTWTNVEVSRKEIKTHYDVEIKLRKSGISQLASGSAVSEDIDEDLVWSVRKRYRQFQSLFLALQRTGALTNAALGPITLPAKASKRRPPKTLSRDYEVKVCLSISLVFYFAVNFRDSVGLFFYSLWCS